jgi:hypothetical protein
VGDADGLCMFRVTNPPGLVYENVSGAEQRCKRSEGNDDAPEHTSALFLDCGFKHDDLLLVSLDEANHVLFCAACALGQKLSG